MPIGEKSSSWKGDDIGKYQKYSRMKQKLGTPNYYEAIIKQSLSKMNLLVIQVLITDSCAYCPTILSICSQFALASEGKIRTVIIDIMAHPDIGEQYNVSTVPYLIINEKKKLKGTITAEELLKELLEC